MAYYFESQKITAKFRYRQLEIAIKIFLKEEESVFLIEFEEEQRAITPGQYAVFYHNDICLGGGAIFCTEKNTEYGEPNISIKY